MTLAFVPRETRSDETRVAAVPDTVRQLVALGLEVAVEPGAGERAHAYDARFEEAGARLEDAWDRADLVLKVQPPSREEAERLRRGAVLVSFVLPSAHLPLVRTLAERGVTTLAMDLIPRVSRAQSMDALSSQATVSGYKAVLVAATQLGRMCPLLMTAAGTIAPARVVVFGAGVAGLQAIATARRLGCIVEATDVRLAAKEQVESLGARFIDVAGSEDLEGEGGYAREATPEFLERQRQEVAKRVAEADIVITTALVPGRPAPKLVSEQMVQSMKTGAVIVDLAVETGGNCELSVADEVVECEGVKIIGIRNLPATVPDHASELFAKNVLNLVRPFVEEGGALLLDLEDDVLKGCVLTHDGEVLHEPSAQALAEEVKG